MVNKKFYISAIGSVLIALSIFAFGFYDYFTYRDATTLPYYQANSSDGEIFKVKIKDLLVKKDVFYNDKNNQKLGLALITSQSGKFISPINSDVNLEIGKEYIFNKNTTDSALNKISGDIKATSKILLSTDSFTPLLYLEGTESPKLSSNLTLTTGLG